MKHQSEDDEDLGTLRNADSRRSSAENHKIDLHKRKRFKRKRPTLPIYFELTAFEASLLQLQQKLAKVIYCLNGAANNCTS